ncbi:MAG: hypothetical protein JW801_11860 [Bacteroidales bacterium]|nr:hypothetical protein [Bacteroidales bacterium]
MMRKLSYILLLLIAGTSALKAQDFLLGVEYGYAKNLYERKSDQLQTKEYPTHQTSLMLEFSPYYSSLYITSGARMKFSELGKEIQFPLTFRVAPGKTIKPFVELGAYYDLAIQDDQVDDYLLKNDLGLLLNGGIMFKFGKTLSLEAAYNFQYGITPSLEQEVLLPLEQSETEQYRQIAKGFTVRLKFRLY